MKILLLATILGVVAGQTPHPDLGGPSQGGFFPAECKAILFNVTVLEYPAPVAGVFSMFCPVINEFVNCLEDNLDDIRRSNSSFYRLVGDYFNSTVIKQRMSDMCTRLPYVGNELECFKIYTNEVQHCNILNAALLLKSGLTLDDMCSGMQEISDCYKILEVTRRCPKQAVEIHRSFMYMFMPSDCQVPSYPTTVTTTTGGPISVIIGCAAEVYPDIMTKISQELLAGHFRKDVAILKPIFEAVEDICRGRSKLAACIKERFKPPFMKLDSIIDKLLTDNAIGFALDKYCSLELSQQEAECLQKSSNGMMICSAMMYSIYGKTQTVVTADGTVSSSVSLLGSGFNTNTIPPQTGNTDPDYAKYLCPAINVANQCVGIHLERCSTTLGKTFINVNKQGFTPECQTVEPTKEIKGAIASSVLLMCSIPYVGELQREFLSYNLTHSDEQPVLDTIRDLIPTGCGFADFYSTCIAKRLPSSENLFDKIARKLLDLTDAARLQQVAKAACEKTKVIQEHFNCLTGVFTKSLPSCISKPEYGVIFKQFQNIYDIDINTITNVCKPIKEIGLCLANLTSNCNKDLGQLAKDLVLELLRTDCGGARPLTSGSDNNMFSLIIAVFFISVALFAF